MKKTFLEYFLNEEISSDYNINLGPNNTLERNTEYYWNMKDPETNLRYSIPMLLPTAYDYKINYIEFMKMKEQNPEAFERVLAWN